VADVYRALKYYHDGKWMTYVVSPQINPVIYATW